ncbi:hypothetical protein AGOR_G00136940 [Albula goreensis]|uniref:Uncharacterized protein n=1 Tax=Albula goreensis TaxID=1534307 RepID=A0A8T3D5A2_9TELE|nr:hypothetical protein AGOR_G00136940 [Albula goreensis]
MKVETSYVWSRHQGLGLTWTPDPPVRMRHKQRLIINYSRSVLQQWAHGSIPTPPRGLVSFHSISFPGRQAPHIKRCTQREE